MPKHNTYRLGSSESVCAPGIVRWAINGAYFPRDRRHLVNIVAATWNIPTLAATALVTRKVAFTVEDETVIFTA